MAICDSRAAIGPLIVDVPHAGTMVPDAMARG